MQTVEYYNREMERIYTKLTGTGKQAPRNNKILFIRKEITDYRKQHRQFLMTLADGDINEYRLLKIISLQDFLAKFSKFTDDIDHRRRAAQEAKQRQKRGR